ncbi:zinc finger MYND domain-containing protein [Candidatus Dependentiae bacterium]
MNKTKLSALSLLIVISGAHSLAMQNQYDKEQKRNEFIEKQTTCRTCGKKGRGLDFCARCMFTRYCSRGCCEKDWYEHKEICKKNAAKKIKKCNVCGEAKVDLTCPGCKNETYCSEKCWETDWKYRHGRKCPQDKNYKKIPTSFCDACKKIGETQTCSRCENAKYCSVACQKKDWRNGHRKQCKAPCAVCEKASVGTCKKCKKAHYCSERCGQLDWEYGSHQNICEGRTEEVKKEIKKHPEKKNVANNSSTSDTNLERIRFLIELINDGVKDEVLLDMGLSKLKIFNLKKEAKQQKEILNAAAQFKKRQHINSSPKKDDAENVKRSDMPKSPVVKKKNETVEKIVENVTAKKAINKQPPKQEQNTKDKKETMWNIIQEFTQKKPTDKPEYNPQEGYRRLLRENREYQRSLCKQLIPDISFLPGNPHYDPRTKEYLLSLEQLLKDKHSTLKILKDKGYRNLKEILYVASEIEQAYQQYLINIIAPQLEVEYKKTNKAYKRESLIKKLLEEFESPVNKRILIDTIKEDIIANPKKYSGYEETIKNSLRKHYPMYRIFPEEIKQANKELKEEYKALYPSIWWGRFC